MFVSEDLDELEFEFEDVVVSDEVLDGVVVVVIVVGAEDVGDSEVGVEVGEGDIVDADAEPVLLESVSVERLFVELACVEDGEDPIVVGVERVVADAVKLMLVVAMFKAVDAPLADVSTVVPKSDAVPQPNWK